MQAEIDIAVNWWMNALQAPNFDNGDAMCNAFARMASNSIPPLEQEKIDKFGLALRRLLEKEFTKGTWDPKNPDYGSYLRCANLSVDYGPGGALLAAANEAGITAHTLRFPCKTNMWCDPGMVRVRAGYGAEIKTIWRAENKAKVN